MTRAAPRAEHVWWGMLMLAGLSVATLGAVAVDYAVQSAAAASWVYLLVVLPLALRWGRAVGIATAVLAALLLLTLLVEPRFSFTVADARDASRVALSLVGMVGAALLVQAHTGSRAAGEHRAPGADPPHATASHHHCGTSAGAAAVEQPVGEPPPLGMSLHTGPPAAGAVRPSHRAAGAPARPDASEAARPASTASDAALPAWVCASLMGILAGLLLAKYAQHWAQETWHPAAVWGLLIVTASVMLTFLAGTRSLVGGYRRRAAVRCGAAPGRAEHDGGGRRRLGGGRHHSLRRLGVATDAAALTPARARGRAASGPWAAAWQAAEDDLVSPLAHRRPAAAPFFNTL